MDTLDLIISVMLSFPAALLVFNLVDALRISLVRLGLVHLILRIRQFWVR